jgi:hypothetical protein
MDAVRGVINSVVEKAVSIANKAGIPKGQVNFFKHLATNTFMLVSVATIVASSLLFSPFFPLYWLLLAAAVIGITVAVRQTDATIAAEKSSHADGSAGAPVGLAGAQSESQISLGGVLTSLLS